MLRHVPFLLCLLAAHMVAAQETSDAAWPEDNLNGFGIEMDTVHADIGMLPNGIDLSGYSTYRIYITTPSPTDQISAIYGGLEDTTVVQTTGQFYQETTFGGVTSEGILPAIWGLFPENQFDSFVTIGIDGPAQADLGQSAVSLLESTDAPWTGNFEAGNAIVINDLVGGGWYVLPNADNGLAGPSQRVLVAQLTTDGDISGVIHAQAFLDGNNLDGVVYLSLPLQSTAPPAPTDCPPEEAPGCTYANACNYAPDAVTDDGSCTFPEPGLNCDGSCLFDTDGDGVCDPDDDCFGVRDSCGVCEGPGAIYTCGCSELPPEDCDCDGQQPDVLGICGGTCEEDLDEDGICDVDEIPGCTATDACNYDPTATEDDGGCDYSACSGCTLVAACNFDPLATLDDGSCSVLGPCDTCIEGEAVTTADADGDGVCDELEVLGCTLEVAFNYNPLATDDDGTCKVFGCADESAVNFDPLVTDQDTSCQYLCTGLAGCTYPGADNFDPNANCDDGTCTFSCPVQSGSCVLDHDGNGLIGANDLVYFLGWYELPCQP